jgi:hypothetical protein
MRIPTNLWWDKGACLVMMLGIIGGLVAFWYFFALGIVAIVGWF